MSTQRVQMPLPMCNVGLFGRVESGQRLDFRWVSQIYLVQIVLRNANENSASPTTTVTILYSYNLLLVGRTAIPGTNVKIPIQTAHPTESPSHVKTGAIVGGVIGAAVLILLSTLWILSASLAHRSFERQRPVVARFSAVDIQRDNYMASNLENPWLQKFDRLARVGPDALQEAVKQLDEQAVQNLLSVAFSSVARGRFQWLHELVEMGYSYEDIAQLLLDDENESPWIFIQPTGKFKFTINVDLHQTFCVHQGGNELTLSPKLVTEDEDLGRIVNYGSSGLLERETIKREIATSCGLAGIIPVSSNCQEWVGFVSFDTHNHDIASVSYELYGPNTTSTIHGYLTRVETALERLVNVLGWLQQNGLCCNSFTILKASTSGRQVEVTQVPFSLITLLVDKVSSLRAAKKKREIFYSALAVAQQILGLVFDIEKHRATKSELEAQNLETVEKTTIHNCALATQSLCLGLLLYSNAHTGPIHPFFIRHCLRKVILLGIEMHPLNDQYFFVELVELTCFGQMVGNAVMVFSRTGKRINLLKSDILASPEDIVDTWGPGRFIVDRSSTKVDRLYAIEIGGGIIRPIAEDAALFHWEKGFLNYEALTTQFGYRNKIRIGATKLNRSCPLDECQSWSVCTSLMENLGTRQDYWGLSEMQTGFQAGQYAVLQFNGTWVKQDGITLKDFQLNATPSTIYLPFLESLWGLQVSLCTGIARRVSVREMLADVMVAYVEKRLPVPALWNDLLYRHNILDHFRGPHLETWFRTLSPELQTLVAHVVRYVLGILGDTGYDGRRDELVIAWPFSKDPFRCFRVPCKIDQHLWARALADSDVCATFAYITPDCLETNEQSCRGSSVSQWQNQALLLDTAVCQHKSNKEPQGHASSWILQPGILYLIGKPGSDLTAKLLEPTTQQDMRLSITRSLIPEIYRRRISKLQRVPVHRIREKQHCVDTNATKVLMLTAPKSRLITHRQSGLDS
jgi:hypothetical protein